MLSSAASLVGAVTGARGAIDAGGANADAATYQAAVARNNKIISDQNATYALQAGKASESNQRQKTAQTIGAQRAAMAANGIDIGSGSPLNLQADTAMIGELDALTIRNNALRNAINFSRQASDFGANASLLDRRAESSRNAGNLNAISSIVGGASSVSDKWATRWRKPVSTSGDSVFGGVVEGY